MSEKAPQTRNREKTRRRLLAAARGLFYEEGICATGVSAVAERAGVTKMTLYAHFPPRTSSWSRTWKTATAGGGGFWRTSFPITRIRVTDSGCLRRLRGVFRGQRDAGLCLRQLRRGVPQPRPPGAPDDRASQGRGTRATPGPRRRGRCRRPATLAERLFVVLEGAYVTGALEGDGGCSTAPARSSPNWWRRRSGIVREAGERPGAGWVTLRFSASAVTRWWLSACWCCSGGRLFRW